MGIFQRKQPKPVETAPGPLDERVRALESSVRQLDADLDDLFDRFQRLQGRRAKREQRAVEETAPTGAEELNERIRSMYTTRRQ